MLMKQTDMNSSDNQKGQTPPDQAALSASDIEAHQACFDAMAALLDNETYRSAAEPMLHQARRQTGSSLALLCMPNSSHVRIIAGDASEEEKNDHPKFWEQISESLDKEGFQDIPGLDNLCAIPLRTEDVVIINSPATETRLGSIPGRQGTVSSFCGIPLRRGNEVVGLFVLINRPEGYDREILQQLLPYLLAGGLLCAACRADHQSSLMEGQLLESRRLESLGKIASGIAHEFNNIYQVLLESVESLQRSLPADHDHAHELGEMRRVTEKAILLTRQLLGQNEQHPTEMRQMNLNTILEEMQPMLERVIREDIRVVMLLNPSLGPVNADPDQIRQLILNLAAGAAAALLQGGRLTFRTANIRFDNHSSSNRPPGLKPGAYATLSISAASLGRAAQVSPAPGSTPPLASQIDTRGTFSAAHNIIRQFDGEIDMDSLPGALPRLNIYLPRMNDQEATMIVDAEGSPDPRGEGETVLLAEDEDAVRTLTQRVLQRNGYNVLTARNGVEALEVAERHDGPIHLLLSDVIMPEMGGKDLVQRLFVTHPDVKVIFMSGYTGTAIQRAGVKSLQPCHYLQKPFRTAELLNLMKVALAGEAATSG